VEEDCGSAKMTGELMVIQGLQIVDEEELLNVSFTGQFLRLRYDRIFEYKRKREMPTITSDGRGLQFKEWFWLSRSPSRPRRLITRA
jgi:hypothetical protein